MKRFFAEIASKGIVFGSYVSVDDPGPQSTTEFLDVWLRYSQDPRCISDQPNTLRKGNLPEFVDHRHDQSICSILAHQMSAHFLNPKGTVT